LSNRAEETAGYLPSIRRGKTERGETGHAREGNVEEGRRRLFAGASQENLRREREKARMARRKERDVGPVTSERGREGRRSTG